MLIIVDRKIPPEAINKLGDFGEVQLFGTSGVTYEAISGHPDVFFCTVGDTLVIAPNIPESFKKILSGKNIPFIPGELPVGSKYPETARYNAVCNGSYLLHNFRYTDSVVTNRADDLDLIHLNQGYARCNLIPLKGNRFITSDEGIFRVLSKFDFEVLLVNPQGIMLPGFSNGFIGGTCGIRENRVFFLGSLAHFAEGEKVRSFLDKAGYEIIELFNGPLYDGGSLLFVKEGGDSQAY